MQGKWKNENHQWNDFNSFSELKDMTFQIERTRKARIKQMKIDPQKSLCCEISEHWAQRKYHKLKKESRDNRAMLPKIWMKMNSNLEFCIELNCHSNMRVRIMMFSGVNFYFTCGLYFYIPLLRKLLNYMFYKYENKSKKLLYRENKKADTDV